MLGVSHETTGSLQIRKGAHGVEVEGPIPSQHTFPSQFLERELNAAVKVWVVIPSQPPVYYEVTGISNGDLLGHRYYYEPPEQSKPKRRWFRRG